MTVVWITPDGVWSLPDGTQVISPTLELPPSTIYNLQMCTVKFNAIKLLSPLYHLKAVLKIHILGIISNLLWCWFLWRMTFLDDWLGLEYTHYMSWKVATECIFKWSTFCAEKSTWMKIINKLVKLSSVGCPGYLRLYSSINAKRQMIYNYLRSWWFPWIYWMSRWNALLKLKAPDRSATI